jgi:hypothetical protein
MRFMSFLKYLITIWCVCAAYRLLRRWGLDPLAGLLLRLSHFKPLFVLLRASGFFMVTTTVAAASLAEFSPQSGKLYMALVGLAGFGAVYSTVAGSSRAARKKASAKENMEQLAVLRVDKSLIWGCAGFYLLALYEPRILANPLSQWAQEAVDWLRGLDYIYLAEQLLHYWKELTQA